MTRLRHRTRFAAAIVAVGLLASACASDGGADSSSVSSPGGDRAPTAATAGVPEALQFTAPLVGGGEFTGADYASKPTVFWFWAPT